MRYDFVEAHRDRWPVRLMCRVPRASPGGYYDWRGRPQSAKARRRGALIVSIEAIHGEVKARYGSPRIHAELAARGEPCCVNTVAKLMRREGIAAKTRRKFRATTDSNHDRPVAENVLGRDFEPGAPDRARTADITYVATGEGWLYPAAVEDLHSRRIVGWSMSERIDSRLVVDALEMALAGRRPGVGLVAHSDRGSQYASEHYRGVPARHGITGSMGRRANCWDNAPMESFLASLKKELTHGESFATRAEARASLFEYIEVFFNRVRRHSSLGYLSPAEYEKASETVNSAPVVRGEVQPWDEEMQETYRERNRMERAFGEAKQFRRFATRYEKLGEVYLGVVRLVFGFIHVKKLARTVNTS